MNKKILAILCGLAVGASAHASTWGGWIAGGNSCGVDNVHPTAINDWLVVTLDGFGVNMPLGELGDGLNVRKTCLFRAQVTPTEGYFLAGVRQVFAGSMTKSEGSSALLSVRYTLGAVTRRPASVMWEEGTEITADDPDASFAEAYDMDLVGSVCGAPTNYGFNLSLTASRRDTSTDFLVGGLDLAASQVKVIPVWAPCAQAP